MKAKPGSRVALAALDKSVLLMRDAKEVTKEEVCGEILIISVHFIIEIINYRFGDHISNPSLDTNSSKAKNLKGNICR